MESKRVVYVSLIPLLVLTVVGVRSEVCRLHGGGVR